MKTQSSECHQELKRQIIQGEAFTAVHQNHSRSSTSLREAACLRAQFPAILRPLEPTDLLAGRREKPWVGFSPMAAGYYCNEHLLRQATAGLAPADPLRIRAERLIAYWAVEGTETKLKREMALRPRLRDTFPSWDIGSPTLPVYPLFRMAGVFLDYHTLLDLGLPGLKSRVQERRREAEREEKDTLLFTGMLNVLELLDDCAAFYADALQNEAKTSSASRQQELERTRSALTAIRHAPPSTFYEAAQLCWLYDILTDNINFGRMDDTLGEYLARDLESGLLSEEAAVALIRSLWRLISGVSTTDNGRVIIGGRGRRNPAAADRFALLAMEASRQENGLLPQLSLRFDQSQNPALYTKALDVLKEGGTFPILYNDDVNVPGVMKAFDIPEAEAEEYLPYGCGEYVINHRSFGTPNGIINLLKVLELTLTDGRCLLTGEILGPQTGKTLADYATFEELYQAFLTRVEPLIDDLADLQALTYEVAAADSSFLLMSLLYDDCIARGKAIFSGGIRYCGGTMETYGNITTADSLTALKQVLYSSGEVSANEVLETLRQDFSGREGLRARLLGAPKFGNDHPVADEMATRLHTDICHRTREQRRRTALHSFLVVVINNVHNVIQGRACGASADGRSARKPMTNANAPTGGMDQQGLTALLLSMSKADTTVMAGAVQNIRVERKLLTEARPVLEGLLKGYYKRGGSQAMLTVLNRGDLEAAMERPEEYRHLTVRVGGFSARFTELEREVQLDLLSRTLHGA